MSIRRVLFVILATAACSRADKGNREAANESQRSEAANAPERSDQTLTAYLAWQCDLIGLVNRQRQEQDEETRRFIGASSPLAADLSKDTMLTAIIRNQRTERQKLDDRMPQGPTVNALGATLPGLGQLTADPQGTMVFIPGRNDAALSEARAKYGADFVDWVVSKEQTIDSKLTSCH